MTVVVDADADVEDGRRAFPSKTWLMTERKKHLQISLA
jgi:hypothetical protein